MYRVEYYPCGGAVWTVEKRDAMRKKPGKAEHPGFVKEGVFQEQVSYSELFHGLLS